MPDHIPTETRVARNYAAERSAAGKYADYIMDKTQPGMPIRQYTHMWGLIYHAYLAGKRGKKK